MSLTWRVENLSCCALDAVEIQRLKIDVVYIERKNNQDIPLQISRCTWISVWVCVSTNSLLLYSERKLTCHSSH